MTRDRRLGLASLAAGLLVIVVTQGIAPHAGPPLYDGVVPIEPYRWVVPPPGGLGDAEGESVTVEVADGTNAVVAVATPELSPQAQLFAVPGGLTLPQGATSIEVSITPLAPREEPSSGYIDGNVYRISVTDQAGNPITADASQQVNVVLRSADRSLVDATIERFDGTTWQPLKTLLPQMPGGGFLAVVTGFGDFAVVASGVSPYPPLHPSGAPSGTTAPTASSGGAASQASATAAPTGHVNGPGTGSIVVGIVVAVVVIGALVLVVAIRRRRRPDRGARRLR